MKLLLVLLCACLCFCFCSCFYFTASVTGRRDQRHRRAIDANQLYAKQFFSQLSSYYGSTHCKDHPFYDSIAYTDDPKSNLARCQLLKVEGIKEKFEERMIGILSRGQQYFHKIMKHVRRIYEETSREGKKWPDEMWKFLDALLKLDKKAADDFMNDWDKMYPFYTKWSDTVKNLTRDSCLGDGKIGCKMLMEKDNAKYGPSMFKEGRDDFYDDLLKMLHVYVDQGDTDQEAISGTMQLLASWFNFDNITYADSRRDTAEKINDWENKQKFQQLVLEELHGNGTRNETYGWGRFLRFLLTNESNQGGKIYGELNSSTLLDTFKKDYLDRMGGGDDSLDYANVTKLQTLFQEYGNMNKSLYENRVKDLEEPSEKTESRMNTTDTEEKNDQTNVDDDYNRHGRKERRNGLEERGQKNSNNDDDDDDDVVGMVNVEFKHDTGKLLVVLSLIFVVLCGIFSVLTTMFWCYFFREHRADVDMSRKRELKKMYNKYDL